MSGRVDINASASLIFRRNLIITSIVEKNSQAQRYLIKDPISGEVFEFGAEEYFLCQSLDGSSSTSQILGNFEQQFGRTLREEEFKDFLDGLRDLGLLESVEQTVTETPKKPQIANLSDSEAEAKKKSRSFTWSFFEPNAFFRTIARWFEPLAPIFKLLSLSLVFGIIFAGFTLWSNRHLFWQDTVLLLEPISFLQQFIVTLFILNLTTKLAQGTVCLYQGGTVREFGITLAFGFLPFFYISKNEIWQLDRKQQLWIFGTPLLYRLFLIVAGLLIWHGTRGAGTALATGSLAIFHAAISSFLFLANPFWPSDGYGWVINFFRLPKTYLSRAFKVWGMMLDRRPLPTFLTLKGTIGLILYGLITVIFWTVFLGYSGIILAASLERNLQGGGVLVFGGIFILFVGWCWWVTSKFGVKADSANEPNSAATETVNQQRTNGSGTRSNFAPAESPLETSSFADFKPKRKRRRWQWLKFALLALFVALLFLPYQYHTGGEIQLLAPDRQEIQAEVDAYVREVFFKGGDGTWIEAGTPIATMEAAEIKNRFLTTKERIQEQQALLKKQQADLDKLQAGARPEEIDIARQRVSVAREELAVAREQFEQARIEAELSARRASRFEQLYRDGAVSLQQSEDNRRLAETDRTTRETANKNVGALQKKLDEAQAGLELVQSGARSEDLEAARQEVIATRAQIRRLEQDLKFLDSQLQLTELVMPFEGKLTTPHLEQKVGSYLEKGDTFAVVENDRTIRGEVAVPEFQVGEISANGRVLVKLSAYPQTTLIGKVISIEPNAREVSYGRIVNVLVELSNSEQILKPGMSGYAKIEGRVMPVIVAFTRAIVRFVLIEVWSWFP